MKKLSFGPFPHAFKGAAHGRSNLQGPKTAESVPLEVVQAADSLLDIFTIYKILRADPKNRNYWPERRTLTPAMHGVERPMIVATLFHTSQDLFAAYKLVNERGIAPDKIRTFRARTDKLEVVLTQEEGLVCDLEMRINGKTEFPEYVALPEYTALDHIMFYTRKFVHDTSPGVVDQITALEDAWGLNGKTQEIAALDAAIFKM